MSTKTAISRLTGDGLRLETQVGSGHTLVLDGGDGDTGARPAELIGAALAGCTAMDVISILRKKRQAFTGYEVRVTAQQMEASPHAFTDCLVVHVVDGPVNPAALARAIELSATKYCSVGSTLASGGVRLRYAYLIRDGADERYAEVLTTGPNVTPQELAGTTV